MKVCGGGGALKSRLASVEKLPDLGVRSEEQYARFPNPTAAKIDRNNC